MKKAFLVLSAIVVFCMYGCGNSVTASEETSDSSVIGSGEALPVTGTFINLAYQDVRNKYTNPVTGIDETSDMWARKVSEMKDMGMEYLVFMAVANEGKAYYPSELMDHHYPADESSPVDRIMDAAAGHGMKVFMSTGWAKDQDDNLRDPAIKGRQIEMMEELARLYGEHPALYGWYLPVEDCLGPVLTDYAVEAVNALTEHARKLTPDKKVLVSPYGIFNSDFDDPRYEQQLSRLKVDIIAYQDEIGCVRERYPLPRLRENWKKLRAIHDKTGIEMWANCESFTWEKGTNDRTSALVPASFSRFLAQQVAATAGGAERIISFIFCGLVDQPSSPYQLGQPHWSHEFHRNYMDWKSGNSYWKAAELGFWGRTASEDPADPRWTVYKAGTHEMIVSGDGVSAQLMVRMLNSRKDGIVPPQKLMLYGCNQDGDDAVLLQIKDSPVWSDTRHDTFTDCVLFEPGDVEYPCFKIVFSSESEVYLETIFNY